MRLNEPIVDAGARPTSSGYWLAAADGGVFTFGSLGFHGSVPGSAGARFCGTCAVAFDPTPSGGGYYIAAIYNDVFVFGDAR